MKKMLQKGFTLIELLVVITIIGILATGAVTVYTSQIQKARDTTRIQDISAIRGAVEQVYQDKYSYSTIATIVADITPYMQRIPQDIKNAQNCAGSGTVNNMCGYVYNVGPDKNNISNGAYEISTGLENKGNLDTKAADSADGGNDALRIEIGTLVTGTSSNGIVTTWASGAFPTASGINITRP